MNPENYYTGIDDFWGNNMLNGPINMDGHPWDGTPAGFVPCLFDGSCSGENNLVRHAVECVSEAACAVSSMKTEKVEVEGDAPDICQCIADASLYTNS